MRGLRRKRSALDNHHLEYFYFPHSSVASDLELSISSGYNFILSLLKRRKSILPRSHGLKFQIRMYAVRAAKSVPTDSCHFPCETNPLQSVANIPCVWKWERIKALCCHVYIGIRHPGCDQDASRFTKRRLQWSAPFL